MPDSEHFSTPLVLAGQEYCIQHLAPTALDLVTDGRPGGVRIQVLFSAHCYSEAYDAGRHNRGHLIIDRGAERAFDAARYELSKGLPAMIQDLPVSKVYGTPEANFFQIGRRIDGLDGEYRMYFRLKKSGVPKGFHLRLFVESAYCPRPEKLVPASKMQKVRFAVLTDKTLRGEQLSTRFKR